MLDFWQYFINHGISRDRLIECRVRPTPDEFVRQRHNGDSTGLPERYSGLPLHHLPAADLCSYRELARVIILLELGSFGLSRRRLNLLPL